MARKGKSSSRRINKIEPSALSLVFNLPNTPSGTTSTTYVDISQQVSLLNRRFYRQGLNWAVAGFKLIGPNLNVGQSTKAVAIVSKLPNTWVMANAWEKSMRAWMRMNREALTESESVRPRFLDFKIYADSEHHAAGFGANALPLSMGGPFTAGEWESSKLVIPNTIVTPGTVGGFELVAVGPNDPGLGFSGLDAKSLIEGYAASRGLPNILDPNTPDDASDYDENWMMALFNDGTQQDAEVVVDMISENNIAPYPFENDGVNLDTMYPNGANQSPGLEIHDFSGISSTTIGNITRLKGGNFPCGLVRIDYEVHAESISHGQTVVIDLIPGTHRGYLAEPMTEM
ncbi:MAG: hypothetical protein [Circular genetic element sp.]|nr:MAG: hypothetical protein [Circular genetic element sp.]